ncbi:MAG: sugar phosphate isomerase/epimerase [Thermoprotei archaeon]|nr:MAG: sugar phosphate isomerase/epimerase [Thermoprotei archaeon]RLF20629.1 MAG: sugar phosphate isomerase/epimerase [Thermoprotei archaeon]
MKLGLQSYSLHKFSFEEAMKKISELGLKYVEAYPGHLPPSAEGVKIAEELEKKYGVKVIAHGVNHMPADEENLRNLFEFAKKVGIEVLTADPEPEALPIVERLAEEYSIKVAIHNHGPGHRYARYEAVLEAIKDRSELLGMCLDTGHLERVGESILEAAKALGSRIHGIHLKDIDENKKDVIIGKGVLNLREFFKILKENGVLETAVIVLEYEIEPENPVPGIKESLENLRKILEEL